MLYSPSRFECYVYNLLSRLAKKVGKLVTPFTYRYKFTFTFLKKTTTKKTDIHFFDCLCDHIHVIRLKCSYIYALNCMSSNIMLMHDKINFNFELLVHVMMLTMILKDIILKMLCVLPSGTTYTESQQQDLHNIIVRWLSEPQNR